MKKNLTVLVLVILALCLVGFAIERALPANIVSAASETHLASINAGPAEKEAVPPARSTVQPVIYVVAGIVCVLFGALAVAPLFLRGSNR